VPIGSALARCGAEFAASWWHWFFLGQPAHTPERVICADPDAWYRVSPDAMGDDAYAELSTALRDPATVHAMCEDYRAGLGIDRAHDDADTAAGRRIACPTLVVWATGDDLPDLYGDVLAVWREWADDLRGAAIACGHHMAEEKPEELAALLRAFLPA
jgi:haloacetate dehalogenase